jgi:hypothetical protein
MRDLVVALPNDVGLPELARSLAASPFEVVRPSDERLSVRLDGEAVEFSHDQSLSEHYDAPEELALLAKLGDEPNLFLVNFKSTAALAKVLAYTVDRPDALVDNDFGDIEPGSDFVQRFRERADWDWVQ